MKIMKTGKNIGRCMSSWNYLHPNPINQCFEVYSQTLKTEEGFPYSLKHHWIVILNILNSEILQLFDQFLPAFGWAEQKHLSEHTTPAVWNLRSYIMYIPSHSKNKKFSLHVLPVKFWRENLMCGKYVRPSLQC